MPAFQRGGPHGPQTPTHTPACEHTRAHTHTDTHAQTHRHEGRAVRCADCADALSMCVLPTSLSIVPSALICLLRVWCRTGSGAVLGPVPRLGHSQAAGRRPTDTLLGMRGRGDVRPKRSANGAPAGTARPLSESAIPRARSMHPGDGRERDQQTAGRAVPCSCSITHAINHENQAHGLQLSCGPPADSISTSQEASRRPPWRSVASNRETRDDGLAPRNMVLPQKRPFYPQTTERHQNDGFAPKSRPHASQHAEWEHRAEPPTGGLDIPNR